MALVTSNCDCLPTTAGKAPSRGFTGDSSLCVRSHGEPRLRPAPRSARRAAGDRGALVSTFVCTCAGCAPPEEFACSAIGSGSMASAHHGPRARLWYLRASGPREGLFPLSLRPRRRAVLCGNASVAGRGCDGEDGAPHDGATLPAVREFSARISTSSRSWPPRRDFVQATLVTSRHVHPATGDRRVAIELLDASMRAYRDPAARSAMVDRELPAALSLARPAGSPIRKSSSVRPTRPTEWTSPRRQKRAGANSIDLPDAHRARALRGPCADVAPRRKPPRSAAYWPRRTAVLRVRAQGPPCCRADVFRAARSALLAPPIRAHPLVRRIRAAVSRRSPCGVYRAVSPSARRAKQQPHATPLRHPGPAIRTRGRNS